MPGIHLNIDCTDFFYLRRAETLSPETVYQYVDQYKGTQVDTLLFNVSGMRAAFFSDRFERIWTGFDPDAGPYQPFLDGMGAAYESIRTNTYEMMKTYATLERMNFDAYQMWFGRCREIGISPWVSIRMNDVHCVDEPEHPFHNTLWKKHPELRRLPYRVADWTDRAFDYAQRQVWEHYLVVIEDAVNRYDIDGIELDWMRFGYHFRPGHEEEGAALMTGYMREVRAFLDKAEKRLGHPIKLSARVPSRPDTSLYLGMDGVAWAREGLIDQLVVTPFWATIETDMPLEIWRQLLDGTDVALAAGLEVLLRPYADYRLENAYGEKGEVIPYNSVETACGAANSFLQRGADVVYLFNYMDSLDRVIPIWGDGRYLEFMKYAGSLDTMRGRPRRHVVTYSDVNAVGAPRAALLPAEARRGEYLSFRVPAGEEPAAGQAARVVLSVEASGEADSALYEVRLNGVPCTERDDAYKPPAPCPLHCMAWRIPQGLLHAGTNIVELHGIDGTVHWVEIAIG